MAGAVQTASDRYFFFNKSSAAAAMAVTPVLIVGSGTGANLLECSDGRGAPVRWLHQVV